MKAALLMLVAFLSLGAMRAGEKPTARDLVGKWKGPVEFGKFKFTLFLRIATNNNGGVEVTLDLPEHGQKGVRVEALLFNAPDVRLEIDQFGTAYNGKINPEITEIVGEFEEGPGGRPVNLVFKRSTEPDVPEPEQTFTFAAGEPQDFRGFWKGEMQMGPGMKVLAGLNIGRLPDGSFKATLDLPEQGVKGIPANLTVTNKTAKFEWVAFQAVLEGTLSDDGKKLSGTWKQMGRSEPREFERVDGPVQVLPKDLSFAAEKETAEDIRGYWKGVLEIPGRKLRLVFKIGRTPDGTYSGTLASIDQGPGELPMSGASYSDATLTVDVRGIRGKYEGKVSPDGKTIDGKWEQFGNPMPLKLERTTLEESGIKS